MVLLPWLAKGKIAKPLLHRNKSLAMPPGWRQGVGATGLNHPFTGKP